MTLVERNHWGQYYFRSLRVFALQAGKYEDLEKCDAYSYMECSSQHNVVR